MNVSVCRLLEPVATLPKLKLVKLAASVPAEAVLVFVFVEVVLELANPAQPARDDVARIAIKMANNVSGVR